MVQDAVRDVSGGVYYLFRKIRQKSVCSLFWCKPENCLNFKFTIDKFKSLPMKI